MSNNYYIDYDIEQLLSDINDDEYNEPVDDYNSDFYDDYIDEQMFEDMMKRLEDID